LWWPKRPPHPRQKKLGAVWQVRRLSKQVKSSRDRRQQMNQRPLLHRCFEKNLFLFFQKIKGSTYFREIETAYFSYITGFYTHTQQFKSKAG
jgi:hypothetical protein